MKLGSLSELSQLIEINPGDVFRYNNYYFEKTGEIKAKYFIVLHIEKEEDFFYGFFTTTVSKYYSHITEEGCFNTTPDFPCYFLKMRAGIFQKDTYIQFNNYPVISLSDLESGLKNGKCSRHFIMPRNDLYQLVKCAYNCKSIERVYKKNLKELKEKLVTEIFRN